VVKFEHFDLPAPTYDEDSGVACRSGSVDILTYRGEIDKVALDGRFCGHHSPGNLSPHTKPSHVSILLN